MKTFNQVLDFLEAQQQEDKLNTKEIAEPTAFNYSNLSNNVRLFSYIFKQRADARSRKFI
jgi:hypothetical protein